MSVFIKKGSASQAPDYSSNSMGTPCWSTLDESKFDSYIVGELIEFCKYEGFRQGWNDCKANRVAYEESNLFDRDFLCGVPYYAWRTNYILGVYNYADEYGLKIKRLHLISEIPLVENAILQLKSVFDLPKLHPTIESLRKELPEPSFNTLGHDMEEYHRMIADEFKDDF